MTVSTTLIGDYYEGRQRERFMSLQTTVASLSAFVLNNLGGLLGSHGWRAPYAVFASSLLLAPLMTIHLWEPKSRATLTPTQLVEDGKTFQPRLLVLTCALAVLLGIVFLIVPVHLGYLYEAIGVRSSAQIGIGFGINSLGVIGGTLLFGWVLAGQLRVELQLALGAAVAGLGLLIMNASADQAALTAGGLVNGLGMGILLPTLVTWNMRELPMSRRGLGIGAFQSSLFTGMFVSPILIVGIENLLAVSRAQAVGMVGMVLAMLAVAALAIPR